MTAGFLKADSNIPKELLNLIHLCFNEYFLPTYGPNIETCSSQKLLKPFQVLLHLENTKDSIDLLF